MDSSSSKSYQFLSRIVDHYRSAGEQNRFYRAAEKLLEMHSEFDDDTFIFIANRIIEQFEAISLEIEAAGNSSLEGLKEKVGELQKDISCLQFGSAIQSAVVLNARINQAEDVDRLRSVWGIISIKNYPTISLMRKLIHSINN